MKTIPPILRPTPFVCPKCTSTIYAVLTPVTRKPKSMSCPSCDWILDLTEPLPSDPNQPKAPQ